MLLSHRERVLTAAHDMLPLRDGYAQATWRLPQSLSWIHAIPGAHAHCTVLCSPPCCPLCPSRGPRLFPVFFNTSTSWPCVPRTVSPRGPGCLSADQGACRVCAVSKPAAARGSPKNFPGRLQVLADRGPGDAPHRTVGLREVREVSVLALFTFCVCLSYLCVNEAYGRPLCGLSI